MKQTIARNLRKLRGNLRQKEVAGNIGVKPSTYRMYELGLRRLPLETAKKIQVFYKLKTLDELTNDVSF